MTWPITRETKVTVSARGPLSTKALRLAVPAGRFMAGPESPRAIRDCERVGLPLVGWRLTKMRLSG